MTAIFKKEFISFFTSMIGFVFIALFMLIIGIYFAGINLFSSSANFNNVLSSVSFVFLFVAPVLTMRLVAEERRQKTDQLLLTAPIKTSDIVIGKFLAVLAVYLIAVAIIAFFPLILSLFGTVSFKTVFAGFLGLILLGASTIAIGLFISSLTESQAIASVASFIILLLMFMMSGLANLIPKDRTTSVTIIAALILAVGLIIYYMLRNYIVAAGVMIIGYIVMAVILKVKPVLFDGAVLKLTNWVSLTDRFEQFTAGIVDLTAIIYYLSIIFLFVFLTVQSIQKRRWS